MLEVWQQVANNLEKVLSDRDFNTWIKPINYDSHDASNIYLQVPSLFFKEMIEEHYQQILNNAISKTVGEYYSAILVVKENESGQDIQPEENFIKNQQDSFDTKNIHTQPEVTYTALNPKYTFDFFVSGTGNQFAHAAAMAVANNPAETYNPLFIYGGVGLGKSHLLNAIGHQIRNKSPETNICYCSAEQFVTEMVNSIRHKKMDQFRAKFRNIDVLLIDDIQFISRKVGTQEELFHTFNALYDLRKQIVITSDKFPKEIPDLEERLRSRFEWGLIADIQPPDLETKIAILKKKSEIAKIIMPDDVTYFLASSDIRNIRELEGMLIRLGAYSSLQNVPITLSMAKESLKDILGDRKKDITVEHIQKVVSEYYGLKPADLKSSKRLKNLVQARQIAIWISRDMTKLSYPDIGTKFGGKDHSTVIYATKKIEQMIKEDSKIAKTIEEIKMILMK
jgi:chromosomal replication initiator protein